MVGVGPLRRKKHLLRAFQHSWAAKTSANAERPVEQASGKFPFSKAEAEAPQPPPLAFLLCGGPGVEPTTRHAVGASPTTCNTIESMDRLKGFEEHRYVGDKRTQVVYDIDDMDGEQSAAIGEELVASGQGLCFGPDTLAEARNRGYRLHRS